jgi:glycosyltransferase involved in cell wall biosynthesis
LNEEKILKLKFDEFIKETKKLPFKHEVVICDNNSSDGTKDLLKNYQKNYDTGFKFIYNEKNLGKGGSIKKAISVTNNDYIVIFDIDEYFLKDLVRANKILKEDNSIDYLIGNRMGYGTKFIYKINLSDIACGTKIFSRKIYNNFSYKKNHFDYEFEVLCRFAKAKAKFREYSILYNPRSFEEGKKIRALRDGTMILSTILSIFFKKK